MRIFIKKNAIRILNEKNIKMFGKWLTNAI